MAKFDKDYDAPSIEENHHATIEDITSSNYFPPPEDQLTQKEVAEMFNRTVQTVINWAKMGKIPYYLIGKKPIYSKKQLIKSASQNQNLINQGK